MPPRIVITSPANLHRQKHFDKLAELVDAGDFEAISAYNMKGIDSYSKMINRYRDIILIAHQNSQHA
jgi:hypothetical protein